MRAAPEPRPITIEQLGEERLLACLSVPRWVAAVRAGAPYGDVAAALDSAARAAATLSWSEVERAMVAHPRLGARSEGSTAEAGWSRQEQSAVVPSVRLAKANAAYEQRFGFLFLLCAEGLTEDRVVAALQARMDNGVDDERSVVRGELVKIAVRRLERVLTS